MKNIDTFFNTVKKTVMPVVKEYTMGFLVLISPIIPKIPQNQKQEQSIKRYHDLYHKYIHPNINDAKEVSVILGCIPILFGIGIAIAKFILKL